MPYGRADDPSADLSYLTGHWSFDPFVVVVAVVVALHERGLRNLARRSRAEHRARRRRSLLFYAGLGVLAVAVVSPIDYWADYYFFVHMVEHILIMFFAPVLIVAGAPWLPLVHGVPVGPRRRLMRAVLLDGWSRPVRGLGRFVTGGWVAVVLFNLTMVVWHFPALFDLAETNQYVHIWLMHSSFFLTGVLFWLQVVPSHPIKPKLGTGAQIAAVLGTNVVMILLAMTLSLFTDSFAVPRVRPPPGHHFVALRQPADRGRDPVGLRGLLGLSGPRVPHPAGGGGRGRRRRPYRQGAARHLVVGPGTQWLRPVAEASG